MGVFWHVLAVFQEKLQTHGRQLWVIKDLSKDRADFGNGGATFFFGGVS